MAHLPYRFRTVLVCLVVLCLSTASVDPRWTTDRDDPRTPSKTGRLTSVAAQAPFTLTTGKRTRPHASDVVLAALCGQRPLISRKLSFGYVPIKTFHGPRFADHSTLPVRAPPFQET